MSVGTLLTFFFVCYVVKSFGTEDRCDTVVPASDHIFEYIVFSGNDIRDLNVLQKKDEKPPEDPAIMVVWTALACWLSPAAVEFMVVKFVVAELCNVFCCCDQFAGASPPMADPWGAAPVNLFIFLLCSFVC